MFNIVLGSDSYKFSHDVQYPPHVTRVHSYLESRGGSYPATLFAGLQPLLKKYFVGPVVTKEKIEEARDIIGAHFGNTKTFNEEMWNHILNTWGGHLPLTIKAVPEGSLIPTRNILVSVVNNDDKCRALTNFIETKLMHVWYPITVATRSYFLKKLILAALEETGDPSLIDFKLHDFGYRGVSSEESAAFGGAGHLVNFKGTDTMAAVLLCREYYNEPMAGFSIPASEHSTITSWGLENEFQAFYNMLKQYPTGLVACVSDSRDIFKACRDGWGGLLREMVLSRDGTLVVRPDSGDPLVVLPAVMEILGNAFGTSINSKGYKVLNPHIRVIQGDGVTAESLPGMLDILKKNHWSIDNIAFGSGGGLLQIMNRDTLSMAFKCSAVFDKIRNEWVDVYKDPITDPHKLSKRGRMVLSKNGHYFSTERWTEEREANDFMRTVFKNGELLIDDSLATIRQRAWG